MYEIKNGVTTYLPVRFLDSASGAPVVGVTHSTVSANLWHSDNTFSTVNPATTADFFELASGAFAGTGSYVLRVNSSVLGVNGVLTYAVDPGVEGAASHVGCVNIVAELESDTYTRIGAPSGASVSADIATVNTGTVALTKINTGRWKIFTSGANANKLLIYDTDNTTVLYTFNLLDSSGTPTSSSPFERVPA